MAEKEERILHIVQKLDGRFVGESSITRTEAICKIARAICRAGVNECIGDCESCDLWKFGPEKEYSEAAVNALLSSGE